MKLSFFLSLAAGALLLTGCSSTPAKVSSGTIHARTFSFVNRGGRPSPEYAEDRQAVHSMIQNAIARNLNAKGVAKTDTGGDVIVGYLVIVGNNVSTTSIDEYFGYGEDSSALHTKAHQVYTSSKNPNYFEAGTLLIDIVDAKTYKVLKRGYATRPVDRSQPDDVRAARIQQGVDEILSDLRVSP